MYFYETPLSSISISIGRYVIRRKLCSATAGSDDSNIISVYAWYIPLVYRHPQTFIYREGRVSMFTPNILYYKIYGHVSSLFSNNRQSACGHVVLCIFTWNFTTDQTIFDGVEFTAKTRKTSSMCYLVSSSTAYFCHTMV